MPTPARVNVEDTVIFEDVPREGETDPYLAVAAEMRPLAESIDGFISVERFQSLTTPGKLLSISFWRDEASLEEWRKLAATTGCTTATRLLRTAAPSTTAPEPDSEAGSIACRRLPA